MDLIPRNKICPVGFIRIHVKLGDKEFRYPNQYFFKYDGPCAVCTCRDHLLIVQPVFLCGQRIQMKVPQSDNSAF